MCEPTFRSLRQVLGAGRTSRRRQKPHFARNVNKSVLTSANACRKRGELIELSFIHVYKQAGTRSRHERWLWLLHFDGVPDELGYEAFSLRTGLNDGQQDFDEAVSSFPASPEN